MKLNNDISTFKYRFIDVRFGQIWQERIRLLSHQVSSSCLHHALMAYALGISRIINKVIILMYLIGNRI